MNKNNVVARKFSWTAPCTGSYFVVFNGWNDTDNIDSLSFTLPASR